MYGNLGVYISSDKEVCAELIIYVHGSILVASKLALVLRSFHFAASSN